MNDDRPYIPSHAAEEEIYTPNHAVRERIFLSAPHMTTLERNCLLEAFDSNWIAPCGPALQSLEDGLCQLTGRDDAIGVVSGTAALHLALLTLGIGPGDIVIVPSLTFVASANVVRYVGATPVFVDCDPTTGNLDPLLLETAVRGLVNSHQRPAAVITVDLYGSCANYTAIEAICAQYGVPIIEDAAEAIGASHAGRPAGSFGAISAFSFNGNKMVTAGGGGALVGPKHLIEQARYLASQARSNELHFEHSNVGYAYGLSNLSAAIASAQLARLGTMIERTRSIHSRYAEIMAMLPGISLLDIDCEGTGNGWLSVVELDQDRHRTPHEICRSMAADGIEARPAWKPMHLQPLYSKATMIGGQACEQHFASGLCLPSGSSMTRADQERVISSFLAAISAGPPSAPQAATVIELDNPVDVRTTAVQPQHLRQAA